MIAQKAVHGGRKHSAQPTDKKKVSSAESMRAAKKLQQDASGDGERIIVRRKSGVQRRGQILEVARDLIFNEGFSNFTIREVAGRVGISEAAIYRHFVSKEELMLALLEAMFTPWREAIGRLVEEKLTFSEKLEELFHLHLHHLLNERLNPVLFFSEAINPQNQRLLEVMRHNLSFLGQSVAVMVRHGLKKKQIRADVQPEVLVASILGLLQTSVIRWTLQRSTDGLLEDGARNMNGLARIVCVKEAENE